MIDLKKIESKVDEILKNESSESLANWLMNKRNSGLNQLLGDGTFFSLQTSKSTFYSNKSAILNAENQYVEGISYYLSAA